jgi:hypothetical protein
MIDEVEVIVYREVYYEHAKPMIRARCSDAEIEAAITPILEGYGWTLDKFKAFSIIDLTQRFERMKMKNVKVMAGTHEVDKGQVSQLLELRCPIRSEQKFDDDNV